MDVQLGNTDKGHQWMSPSKASKPASKPAIACPPEKPPRGVTGRRDDLLPWLPWACLLFTLVLFVMWLDTVITWFNACDSAMELVRNGPWVVLSAVVFIASIVVYARDLAATKARKGYVEIA